MFEKRIIKFKNNSNLNIYCIRYYLLFLLLLFFNIAEVKAQEKFENVVKIQKEITFDNLIGIVPPVTTDKWGNFITTNYRQKKVIVYDSTGTLLYKYGRMGKGPGDFLKPVHTIRLSNGQLLTAEIHGKLSLFTATGDSLLKIYKVKIRPLIEVHQINGNSVLLMGRKSLGEQVKLLHIFNLEEGVIKKSFLDLPFSLWEYQFGGIFSSFIGLPDIDVHKGKIATTIGPFEKIYIYDQNAKLIRTVNFSLKYFENIKKVNKRLTVEELSSYVTTFSRINKIFWLDNNTFLISYFRYTNFKFPNVRETQHSIANIGYNGKVIFEIKNAPELAAFYSIQDVYFEDPNPRSKIDLLEGKLTKFR